MCTTLVCLSLLGGAWELAGEELGVVIWTRETPGLTTRELRAEAFFPVPAERVWEVLLDVHHYIEFMPYIEKTLVLGTHPEGHFEYQLLDPPIVSKRDYVAKVTLKANPKAGIYERRWTLTMEIGPPPSESVVRVSVNDGAWKLERHANGHTRVTYLVRTDPGGAIPAWVANRANKESIPALLDAVRKRSMNPSWRR